MNHHPTISAWARNEDGSYRSEKNGWELTVRWTPERPNQQRGFSWVAEHATGQTRRSHDIHEEMELAMAEAEELAAHGES